MRYDFTIGTKKFQEKVLRRDSANYVSISHGSRAKPYKVGDNDFYWLHFPDKTKFLLLPEIILIDDGIIKTSENPGNLYYGINISHEKYIKYIFDYENINTNTLNGIINL